MATQQEKDIAIKALGGVTPPETVALFMGIDINEFSKEELIKILSIQNRKWLESLGFGFSKGRRN